MLERIVREHNYAMSEKAKPRPASEPELVVDYDFVRVRMPNRLEKQRRRREESARRAEMERLRELELLREKALLEREQQMAKNAELKAKVNSSPAKEKKEPKYKRYKAPIEE